MKNKISIIALCFLLLGGYLSPQGLGIDKDKIRGVFFTNTEKEPLPGALIALYNADTNLLLDYTYSLENGQFTLKAPPIKGKFFIVATKGMISKKHPFEFDPGKPGQYLSLQYKDSPNGFFKFILWLILWFLKKSDYMITTTIGIIIGLVINWLLDRRKRKKKQENYIRTLRGSIKAIWNSNESLGRIFKEASIIDIRKRYLEITGEIKKNVENMEKKLDPEVFPDVFDLKKKNRQEQYETMADILKKIRFSIDEKNQDNVIKARAEERERDYFQSFRDLKEQLEKNPLLNFQ